MADDARRCALPGCDETIEDAAGRPARRYCTAAHRSAARQARRASMQAGADEQLSATLPWLREPDPDPRDAAPGARPVGPPVVPRPSRLRNRAERRAAGRSETPPGRRTPGLHTPVPRRRRALAVLGAAGILAGGYAVTASQPLDSPATTAAASEEDWARDARVTLASVNRQLDSIAEVEAEWNRLPAERRAAAPVAPVEALVERRELLENRRATLRSQLDSFEQLDEVRAELAQAEQNLASLEATLAAAPPASQRTREQAGALAALTEQRDLRIRQRDAHRDELAALEGGVEDATARPLSDDVQQTERVGEQVRQVIRGEDVPAPTPAEPLPPRPDVTSGRDEQEGSPRQDVDTSGPPDPRGPGDDTVDVPPPTDTPAATPAPTGPPGPPARDEGPVDQLAEGLDDTVDTVVGGADARDRDRDRAADRPADPGPADDVPDSRPADRGPADPSPAEDRGPVETVVDTVEDVADGPGRSEESSGRPADRNREEAAAPADEVPADEGPVEEGPVEEVVDTVGDTVGGVVAGPDQPADEARKRDRDKGERDRSDAERSAGADDAPAAGPAHAPAAGSADDDVAAPREVTPRFDDRYPDAPAGLRAAPAPPVAAPVGAAPDGPAPVGPAPVADAVRADDARVAEAALAMAVVRATPASAWVAPLVEAAVEEAARQQAAEPSDGSADPTTADPTTADPTTADPTTADPSTPASAPAPVGSVEAEAAAAALAMWGFDDDDIDTLNQMAADAGYAERIPTRTTGGEQSAAAPSDQAAYGTPSRSSTGEDTAGDILPDPPSGYVSDGPAAESPDGEDPDESAASGGDPGAADSGDGDSAADDTSGVDPVDEGAVDGSAGGESGGSGYAGGSAESADEYLADGYVADGYVADEAPDEDVTGGDIADEVSDEDVSGGYVPDEEPDDDVIDDDVMEEDSLVEDSVDGDSADGDSADGDSADGDSADGDSADVDSAADEEG